MKLTDDVTRFPCIPNPMPSGSLYVEDSPKHGDLEAEARKRKLLWRTVTIGGKSHHFLCPEEWTYQRTALPQFTFEGDAIRWVGEGERKDGLLPMYRDLAQDPRKRKRGAA